MSRQLVVISGHSLPQDLSYYCSQHNSSLAVFCLSRTHLSLPTSTIFPFAQAKNALGQEWRHVLFDARFSLNLDALAIACGTVRKGGTIFFWVESWENFLTQVDQDSSRWADGQTLPCPHFRQFFQQQVEKAGFPVLGTGENIAHFLAYTSSKNALNHTATRPQQALLQHFHRQQTGRFILTAKRGRGKSAFAGMWATHLLKENPQQLFVTAPNKKAVQTLQQFCPFPLPFIAPDHLLKQAKAGEISAKWLLIDEASMLPLPILKALTQYFSCILCTTTVESYEGTGQGFSLKFMQDTACHWQHFSLEEPLRFGENDPLENFMETLLLQKEDVPSFPLPNAPIFVSYFSPQLWEKGQLKNVYSLLKSAHYRTTPLDLRRLFDAPKQQFFLCQEKDNAHLLGGIWAVEEGDIQDLSLLRAIQRGERRPKGNLVVQCLTQYALSNAVCRLRSKRISRIAIQPHLQHQGLGQTLVKAFCEHVAIQKQADFLSVSFGYEDKLAHFWQKCGFDTVFISEKQTASSGCYSAIALRGISTEGITLCQQLRSDFWQNFSFSAHPFLHAMPTSLAQEQQIKGQGKAISFSPKENQALFDFAYAKRDFFMTIPMLARLNALEMFAEHSLLGDFFQHKTRYAKPSWKVWLSCCRQEVQKLLAEMNT